jgi:hypothetical protein
MGPVLDPWGRRAVTLVGDVGARVNLPPAEERLLGLTIRTMEEPALLRGMGWPCFDRRMILLPAVETAAVAGVVPLLAT